MQFLARREQALRRLLLERIPGFKHRKLPWIVTAEEFEQAVKRPGGWMMHWRAKVDADTGGSAASGLDDRGHI